MIALVFSLFFSNAHAQLLATGKPFWVCEVICGSVSASQFKINRSKKGLVGLKQKKESDPTLDGINLWPIGYKFKLDRPGQAHAYGAAGSYGCDGSGETAAKAMESLESRITGKGLSVVAIRCGGCSAVHLKDATCTELKTRQTYPFSVLQSRMSTEPGAGPDTTSRKAD